MNIEHFEFQKKMQEAHNCLNCQGKIFCISIDKFGATRCGYCNEIVIYPPLTRKLSEALKRVNSGDYISENEFFSN